jgi:ethanolamine utilization protein EutA
MVLSELTVENRAGAFAVPEMEIAERKILYRSPVHFTPLLKGDLVDADSLRRIVDGEYERAGIRKQDVDTGAIIITGETSRKENARAVLDALSEYAGDFVVAAAGPDLESVLAAKGAGAVEFSRKTGKTVLHMDIGGGTTNLALIEDGKITATGCLNVGGRLLKIDSDRRLVYVSPVLQGIFAKQAGDSVTREEVAALAETLAQVLEMAAGLREESPVLRLLLTPEAGRLNPPENAVISFSGGVADCIEKSHPFLAFGDLGPELGQAIRESRLCRNQYMLGSETIRATVIGAGSHSTQISGSTVFCQNVRLPLKNLPVVEISDGDTPADIGKKIRMQDSVPVLAMKGIASPGYRQVAELAEKLICAVRNPVYLALEVDMAKALGQQLSLRLGKEAEILCIDRVRLEEGSFLDVGTPVGPALPVVIKTLILSK